MGHWDATYILMASSEQQKLGSNAAGVVVNDNTNVEYLYVENL